MSTKWGWLLLLVGMVGCIGKDPIDTLTGRQYTTMFLEALCTDGREDIRSFNTSYLNQNEKDHMQDLIQFQLCGSPRYVFKYHPVREY